ncbi:probable leucine-rich repeat receptor-like protein kinase At5g49770 [Selaginella moellendorffii]|uniref:probable leucine-rich repeat receptor-like protein kinase At5g49770 n=1 Tax=Selaginella moellendorffii TaxID=88036 RepID=UPI000D1CDFC6|nr:probable leucine-rich repeat receptor-like protein kinase At5g49770 [Selaginella moellendorffii]|eukprot:XP_024523266.1 probable leucine-rich repeat receptor-like protein kinase At5g49770 [Selaginella moellendorffii]
MRGATLPSNLWRNRADFPEISSSWGYKCRDRHGRGAMEWIALWFLVLGVIIHRASPSTFESDTSALRLVSRGFRNANLQWSGGDPCGSRWIGVSCNSYNVTKLILNNMNIAGQLPLSIGNLANLQTLDLSFNPDLTGPLPKTLGQLTKLEFLNLQSCGFTGDIPFEIGGLKSLRFLALNMNKLSGVIPPELGRLSSVYWFDLAQNQIAGPLPVSSGNSQNIGLDNLTAAVHFHLNSNKFTGSIPPEICFLPELKHLLLDNNGFSGEVPDEIGNFSKLTIMRLDKNQFTGSLPSSLGRISTLFEINTNDNAFTGTLPDLSGLKALQLISVGNNSFSPQPVPSFAGLTGLQTIEINDGNLIGPIPDGFFQFARLESVSLTGNSINGTVDFTGASPSLVKVQLDNNKITNLNIGSGVFTLSLAGNPVCDGGRLSDVVCASKLLTPWKENVTCANSCSGQQALNPNTCSCGLPLNFRFQFNAPTFSSMTTDRANILRKSLYDGLSLSPDQVWVDTANFTSDKRLLVEVFIQLRVSRDSASFIYSQISMHQLNLDYFGPYSLIVRPPPIGEEGEKHGISTAVVVGIIVAVLLAAIIVIFIGIYAYKQKRRADKAIVSNPFASWGSRGKDSGTAPQLKGARFFSIAELKKATNNFISSSEIGSGGYGKVYKGTLSTGEEVAIKRAQEGSLQGAGEFKNEIELLSRVHHRNLVGLIGFCYESGEQMLVYEYMPNGTIREHLPGT